MRAAMSEAFGSVGWKEPDAVGPPVSGGDLASDGPCWAQLCFSSGFSVGFSPAPPTPLLPCPELFRYSDRSALRTEVGLINYISMSERSWTCVGVRGLLRRRKVAVMPKTTQNLTVHLAPHVYITRDQLSG